ncbi:hypothetical protein GE115_08320 [Agromyces sp. CFH 90414]|uniref:Uncharacterized protein n=1 Tax=Agromyces agglutinans TaxID=2662258 RepID=A0A6I2F5F7_9MICO|nr:hypothetical protein [Agromyces agglutinans]MRG59872.1 hypothetical protein [Agromyces agglutinans]
MTQTPFDPTRRPDDAPPAEEPRLLPTIDAASPVGRALRESFERLRFAPNVDPAIREAAQSVLDGRSSPRELLRLPQMQPLIERAASAMRADVEAMTPEERAALFTPPGRAGRDA